MLQTTIGVEATPEQLELWLKSRKECEQIYADAMAANDRDALRWLARHDRYFLLTVMLRRPDARHEWLFRRCREVEADPDDRIDLWARDHYKSTIITFAGIIQEILKDPNITVGIFSHNRPTAKAFMRQIMEEFEQNKFLISLFPDVLWENPRKSKVKWSIEDGLVVKRSANPKEATIEAWGLLDGMPTGKHFRLRVYDDIITEENVTTPDMIRKTTERYELSEHLGTRDGRMWVIGTRYHFADTYAVMIQRGVLVERRHAATVDGTFDGEPVFLTPKQWDKKKRGSSKSTLAAQMLLNPLAGAETVFDILKLQFWRIRPKVLNIYIIMDPSKGKNRSSDYTALAVIGVDVNRNRYLLDGCRHRMPLSKRWQLLVQTYKRWSAMDGVAAVFVGYEQFGMQTDMEYFEERMEIEGIHIPIEELNWPQEGPKSKAQRIERLEPEIRTGKFRLPAVIKIDEEGNISPRDPKSGKLAREAIERNESWRLPREIHKTDEDGRRYDVLGCFIEEFVFFPFAPHDDLLDSCSRIYDMSPVPPVLYDQETGGDLSTEPEHFMDS